MAENVTRGDQGDPIEAGQSSSPRQPDPKVEKVEKVASEGLTSVVLVTGGITLLMYLQIVGAYKYFHKRHPHIFIKPKLPPFEVMRERVRNSKLAKKLKQAAKPDGEAKSAGTVHQGYVDDDIQQRPVSSRAPTRPRVRTARRPGLANRVRKVNRQMRVNKGA